MIQSFRDLEVYKESYSLMLVVHKIMVTFPLYERNDIVSQMRRASKSGPSNIAEGWAKREFEKEFKKHIGIALGSANEMEVHLETSKDLGYLSMATANSLIIRYQRLGGKLNNLRKSWKKY